MTKSILLIAAILINSCSLFPAMETTTSSESVMASLVMYAGSSPSGARAVIPYWLGEDTTQGGFRLDYPWPGQVTRWVTTEEDHDGVQVYRVHAITFYPEGSAVERTDEVYQITADNVYFPNSLEREVFETRLRDGSIRVETIVADTNHPTDRFSLDAVFFDDDYSFFSVVTYTQQLQDSSGSFDNIRLIGERYYTNKNSQERLLIKEEGFVINLVIDGQIYRGRTDVESRIEIIIDDRVVTHLQGYYRFTTPRGVHILLIGA